MFIMLYYTLKSYYHSKDDVDFNYLDYSAKLSIWVNFDSEFMNT